MGSHGASLFLVPILFRENPHLLLPLCMVHYGEYLLASQMRIPFVVILNDYGLVICILRY
jgi:hypothetical protein